MPRGVRVNVVSPPWIWKEPPAGIKDPSIGMTALACAAAYAECVEGGRNGETLDASDFGAYKTISVQGIAKFGLRVFHQA
jgi:hypothetical protein